MEFGEFALADDVAAVYEGADVIYGGVADGGFVEDYGFHFAIQFSIHIPRHVSKQREILQLRKILSHNCPYSRLPDTRYLRRDRRIQERMVLIMLTQHERPIH